jgi:PAS domain S-box-containing protein
MYSPGNASKGFSLGAARFSPRRPTPGPEGRPDSEETAAQADTEYFFPFQHIPIPVHSIGPDGLLRDVNGAWVDYTGYAKTEAIGRSFADFLDPPSAMLYREKAVPELIDTVPDKESRSFEYRLTKRSGDIADIVLTARPERDPATGRFLHSLSVIIDITARNRAEAALRQAQKLEALGSLTGGVAHDFNNLLMIILGSLELLGRRLPPEDARATRLLDAALQGARRGAALTARLLTFARQQELAPISIDVHSLLGALRPMLAHLLGPAIRIEDDLPADLWNLRADPNQLELALLNLAANARDAMPDGGTLRLSARNAAVDPAETSFIGGRSRPTAAAGEYVVLKVSDTGAGMDEATLARAAEPLFTTKGPGKGTGLGLSMVHGFVVQSGGALQLSSRPGAGTSVELWLPRTTDPVREAGTGEAAPDAPAVPGAESLRILLVDDDPLVVEGTASMLEELGHVTVQAATSGEEALAMLRQDGNFDLLLTDHLMPGMTGLQLVTAARALHPTLPILLASGFAELDDLAGSEWPRLRKPYSLSDLSTALAIHRSGHTGHGADDREDLRRTADQTQPGNLTSGTNGDPRIGS